MADLATLKSRLLEAELAEHKLSIGAKEASVNYDGQQVAFQSSGINQLRLYIARLKADIALAEGGSTAGSRRLVATF